MCRQRAGARRCLLRTAPSTTQVVPVCVGVRLHGVHTGGKLEGRSLVKETIYGHDALNAPVLASRTTAQCGVAAQTGLYVGIPRKRKRWARCFILQSQWARCVEKA